MALTHERNKSNRTKKGCILCYNLGAASTTFAYVYVKFIPMFVKGEKKAVEKELGLCFKHCRAKSETNPTGILDPEKGMWLHPFTRTIKEGGGGVALRDELYYLVDGNTKLLTGPAGKIPQWW